MKGRILGVGWVDGDGPGQGRGTRRCHLRPGELPRIERSDIFAEPDRRFGRLDDFSRLGLAAIALALQDAGLDTWQDKRPWGVIAASRYGSLATDQAYFATAIPEGGALASPHLFAYTLANCFTGEAAIRFGLTGPSYVIGETGSNSFAALELALETLADGEAPVVVAGISDLPFPGKADPQETPGAVFLVVARDGDGPEIVLRDNRLRLENGAVDGWNQLVAAAQPHLR